VGPERLRCFFVQERQRVVEGLGHRCGVRLLEVPRKRISQTPKAQRQNHCVLVDTGERRTPSSTSPSSSSGTSTSPGQWGQLRYSASTCSSATKNSLWQESQRNLNIRPISSPFICWVSGAPDRSPFRRRPPPFVGSYSPTPATKAADRAESVCPGIAHPRYGGKGLYSSSCFSPCSTGTVSPLSPRAATRRSKRKASAIRLWPSGAAT